MTLDAFQRTVGRCSSLVNALHVSLVVRIKLAGPVASSLRLLSSGGIA